jgi:hypothetical protein
MIGGSPGIKQPEFAGKLLKTLKKQLSISMIALATRLGFQPMLSLFNKVGLNGFVD